MSPSNPTGAAPPRACPYDTRRIAFETGEGLVFELYMQYAPGAPNGADPESITGFYHSPDAGGCISVWRDGVIWRNGNGDAGPDPNDLLPWVVARSCRLVK